MSSGSVSISAVILAGGKGSRLGEIDGQILPKCLLPMPGRGTLLEKLLNDILSAGVQDIRVCCSTNNFSQIDLFLASYREPLSLSKSIARAVDCENCRFGPVPALIEMLRSLSTEIYLVALGDIVFAGTPIRQAVANFIQSNELDCCLLTGEDEISKSDGGTGFVFCDQQWVRGISYRKAAESDFGGLQERRWTGAFLIRAKAADALYQGGEVFRDGPLEIGIQRVLDHGFRCGWQDAGTFINVNSPCDYARLITPEPVDLGN